MNESTSIMPPYEAPRIEDRATIDAPLVGGTSNIDSSAVFRSI
jgi:hypothetical protein